MKISYKWIVNDAVKLAEAPNIAQVVYQRPEFPLAPLKGQMDLNWADEVKDNMKHDCVSVGANDPLYILYTSGTTGKRSFDAISHRHE